MKKFLSLNFLLLTCFSSYAQTNMVPNGNFEAYTTCPNDYSQITYATGWASWTDGSIDYFNTCATNARVIIPNNTFGYQYTASGNGYIGGYQDASSANPYKEYATRPITPLQVGARYEVSISVSLANVYGAVAVDDIGIYFYDAGPTHISTINRVPVVAQVDFSGSGPFVDTQNWVRLVKTFVADSAYDNIVIGSFKDPATVVKQQVGTGNYSYYFFDSVVVRQFDTAYIVFSDTLKCPGDSFGLQYFVPQAGVFVAGNVFTAQFSDASGSFAGSPTNIGAITSATSGVIPCKIPLTITPGTHYRIRIVASTPNYISRSNGRDIYINPLPAKPNFGSNSPICNGDMLYLADSIAAQGTVSIYGPKGFLSSGLNHSISNAQLSDSGYYYIVDSLNGCTSSDTTFVRIDSIFTPTVNLSVSPANNLWPYVQVTFSALVNYGLQHTIMQWYKNGNILPGETNVVYTPIAQSELVAGDIVCVKITNTSKCVTIDTASACAQPVQINLNITDDTVAGTTVFPNPNNGKFIVETLNHAKDISFDVINTLGQVIYKNNILPVNGIIRKEIDLGDVPKGVYILRMKTESGMLVERLNIN